jgi:hypothetical protein
VIHQPQIGANCRAANSRRLDVLEDSVARTGKFCRYLLDLFENVLGSGTGSPIVYVFSVRAR